jgi:hypothetical protein
MKGYAYLDLDNNVIYKSADYIDNDNPGFFLQNHHYIIKHWKFNTDDARSMWTVFSALTDLKIPVSNVRAFIDCIGYDMNRLRDANKI